MAERRVAIVGFGLAGASFHAPLVSTTPGLELATIVTGDPGRQARARDEHPGARVVARVDELWERAAEHDLVVVAAANNAHAELARRGLEAGLAVVVDKPLTSTAAEARALVACAAEHEAMLTVFHNRRWDSDQLTLKRLRTEDALGEVLRFESRFERWRPDLRPDAWRETAAAAEGGGILLDLGTHLVDQALVLFGSPTHVYAEIESRRGATGEDEAFVSLRHRGGTYSQLWVSAMAAAPGPRLRVLGSRAAYVVDELDGQEAALRSGLRPDGAAPWGVEARERWGRLVRGEESEAVPSEAGAWPRFYVAVERALREGGPPPVDPADAVATLEVLEAARRSAAAATVVDLTALEPSSEKRTWT
jgi:scyllo-inositol 2-dehydrogenase (NADP+)